MKDQFISYRLLVKLKFLGFDEKCFDIYQDDTSRKLAGKKECTKKILWQQAFDWFRENHDLLGEVSISANRRNDLNKWMYSITFLKQMSYTHSEITYNSYEDSRKMLLEKLIEIVENEKM